jgi:hypothetical protein
MSASLKNLFKPKIITILSVAAGLVIGIFFHYLLYRYALPSKPFIYVAF